MTKDKLISVFDKAKKNDIGFIGVSISIDNNPNLEIIINPTANFESKLEYYKKTYDKNLNHLFAKDIQIIDCVSGDSFGEIEDKIITISI